MLNQIYKLDQRLLACAKFVRKGSIVVDVGTDHAYLPIWLYQKNIIKSAIASDLREGPLLNAQNNISRFNLSNVIKTRLSNGLDAIKNDEVDDIIISGLGGEIITDIIKKANWLKDPSKHLILQPMTKDEHLREYLAKNNFNIKEEITVISSNKVYSVMSAYHTITPIKYDKFYPYVGKINIIKPHFETQQYILKKINSLEKRKKGLLANRDYLKANELNKIIIHLKNSLN